MELVLKESEKLKVVFEGKEYFLSKPKMALARRMEVEAKAAAENGKTADLVCSFLVACGMPQEVVDELEPEQSEQIIEMLQPKKKK